MISNPYTTNTSILIEAYQKVTEGIKFLINRYDKFNVKQCHKAIDKKGLFSARPYQSTQPCDGSIGNCVLALYQNFCHAMQLNPILLLRLAYPDETHNGMDFTAIKTHGNWQGVAYPETWNQSAFDGLLISLQEINYHALAGILEDLISWNETESNNSHTITIIWSVEDALSVRPDLTTEQALRVLKQVKYCHDASVGINWETIKIIAEDMYSNSFD